MKRISKPALIVTVVVAALVIAAVSWGVIARMSAPREGTDEHVSTTDPLQADPKQAATSAMTGLMTWDPARQNSPQDSAAAIVDRLTGQLEQYATSNEPDSVLPELWATWRESGDRVHAVTTADEDGVDLVGGGSQAVVDVVVEQEVWHPSGETTPYSRFSATVEVHDIDGQWKAERYEITEAEY
ncbi:hypothetical protein ACXZ66_04100 [Corynebacterium sp. S7]